MHMEPVMSDSNSPNIEAVLARMEGKIDRVNDRMERYERDTDGIRGRIHTIANEVQILVGLNLPAHVASHATEYANTDARITALERAEERRKGAAGLAKVLWAIFGGAVVSGAAMVVRIIQVGGI